MDPTRNEGKSVVVEKFIKTLKWSLKSIKKWQLMIASFILVTLIIVLSCLFLLTNTLILIIVVLLKKTY